jgi:predicted HTH transcriptional regulator
LVLVLNPPERWFGSMGMLRSPEYLELKRGAELEENAIETDRTRPEESRQRRNDMSPAEQIVFDVIDDTPRQGPEIASRISVKIDAADIRRYLSQLKKRGYIGHLKGQGYYRL